MLWVFGRRQRRMAHPLIDFSLFRNRTFCSAVAAAIFAAAALLGMELVFTQRLQLVLDLSPLQAAVYLLPLPVAAFVSGPLAGWMLPRAGERRMLAGACCSRAWARAPICWSTKDPWPRRWPPWR